jgi:hypothetical protein
MCVSHTRQYFTRLMPQSIVASAHTAAIPECPNIQDGIDQEVRTYSGAGAGRFTSTCTCGLTWNQKRPDMLLLGEDPVKTRS